MYPLRSFTNINELQIHLKHLLAQARKCIEQQSQSNSKMYFYNFQKVSLKLHKFTIEFISHLTIPQNIYNAFDEIRSIFCIFNNTAKKRKARSSRTYLGEDVFGLFASRQDINDPKQQSVHEKEELDIIEQFMIKRNHQFQSNIFGDVDDVFKNRQRKGLEEFLSHANLHAKNLQNELKSASVQRSKIVATNKIGRLTKGPLIKKLTYDLERINQLDSYNKYDHEVSRSSFMDVVEKSDHEVQTIFSNQNINWNKILIYCMKTTQVEEKNQNIQFKGVFDREVYRNYDTVMLLTTQMQTQSIQEIETKKETQLEVSRPTNKKSAAKVANKLTIKASNMKPNRQKTKQAKISTLYVQNEEKQQALILNSPQKRLQILQLQSQIINQCIQSECSKQNTQQQVIVQRKNGKKLTKAIQPRQIVFQFKTKKQNFQEKRAQLEQSFRSHKKNKTTIGKIRSTSRTVTQKFTENQINIEQRKTALATKKSKESLYQKSNKEDNGRERKNQKQLTLKNFIGNQSAKNKSTVKINGPISDRKLNDEDLSISKIRQSDSKENQVKQDKLGSNKNPKSSNFKQLYATMSPNLISRLQDKTIFNQKNTTEQIYLSNQHKIHNNSMTIELSANENDSKLIKQEDCEVSNRKTSQNLPLVVAVQGDRNQDGHSKITQKSSHQLNTQTKRTSQFLQSRYDKPISKKQIQGTGVLYKWSIKPKQQEQLLQNLNNKSQKKQHTNAKVKTLGKEDQQKSANTTRAHRNSLTVHSSLPKNNKIHFNISVKTHNKNFSHDIPNLTNCKQKLSEIKKNFSKDFFKNISSNNDKPIIAKSNLKKNLIISSSIKHFDQGSKIRETKNIENLKGQKQNAPEKVKILPPKEGMYQKMISFGQSKSKIDHRSKPKLDNDTGVISTIRRLLMTNSYRDKLLLYLSMIEVMHEKCCGKHCEHMNKFMSDITGGVDVAEESVAKQLLKMYSTRTINFKDVTNAWC